MSTCRADRTGWTLAQPYCPPANPFERKQIEYWMWQRVTVRGAWMSVRIPREPVCLEVQDDYYEATSQHRMADTISRYFRAGVGAFHEALTAAGWTVESDNTKELRGRMLFRKLAERRNDVE